MPLMAPRDAPRPHGWAQNWAHGFSHAAKHSKTSTFPTRPSLPWAQGVAGSNPVPQPLSEFRGSPGVPRIARCRASFCASHRGRRSAVKWKSTLSTVSDDLELGERAAIALAETMHADLLLIDEAAGRAEAKRRHLRVTGTLGVLRSGAEQGLVNVPDLLERLRTTSFYLDQTLLKAVLERWLRR